MRISSSMAAVVVMAWSGLAWNEPVFAQSQRSAESDCQREAARRGYSVLRTRNFEQYRDGWSLEMEARDRAGRVSWGSCFVETRSGDVSLYGFGWGSDGSGSQYEFNCASVESKYRECQLPVNGRARLVKQKSDAPCIEDRSWGQRGDRVWVDDGCRANFEVIRSSGGGGNTVECRSEQERYRECRIASGYVGRLVSDDSRGKCSRQGGWGTRSGLIWVSNGCKGRFDVVRAGGGSSSSPGWSPGGGGSAEAERACLNEAGRRWLRVVGYDAPRVTSGGYRMSLQVRHGNGAPYSANCRYWSGSRQAEISP